METDSPFTLFPAMARPRKKIDLKTYEGRFAWRLMVLREKAGLTVEEAAEKIGIAASTVYAWERALNAPHPWLFPKIAEIYKVNKAKNLLPGE